MIPAALIKSCSGRDGFGTHGWRDEMMLDDVWNRMGPAMRAGVCLFCLSHRWRSVFTYLRSKPVIHVGIM